MTIADANTDTVTNIIIYARDLNGLIGVGDNDLPWRGKQKGDMKHFRNTTLGEHLLVGYNTYNAIGAKGLKDRVMYMFNTRSDISLQLSEIHKMVKKEGSNSLFVIGGAKTYDALEKHCQVVIETVINAEYPANDRPVYWKLSDNLWELGKKDIYVGDKDNEYSWEVNYYRRK